MIRFYILLLSVISFCGCSSNQNNEQFSKGNTYASLEDTIRYVGINTCKQCHADKYETFVHTGMGMSFDLATRKKSAAIFGSNRVIDDKNKNFRYYPFWSGDSLYLKEFRLTGRDTTFSRIEQISYIVGSGQHTNSHLMNWNGYLYQAPATFYTQKGKWDLPPGFENGFNSRFDRKIELECMTCHNALPEMVEGSINKFNMIPSGIDCERCHGPGDRHVREKLAGDIIDVKKAIDYSIVNPAKLSIDLQLDVCQRCHVQGNAVLKKGKTFFDFKPGMHLSEVMNVFMPVYKGDDDSHIMASHAERLKQSSCFIVSLQKSEAYNKDHPSLEPYKNALTCITCHNPHVSVRETDPDVFNKACRSCHQESSETAHQLLSLTCSASKKERLTVDDNCTSCHMPKNGTIDIPHVRVTDHRIRRPVSTDQVKKIREFVGLACINNPTVEKVIVGEAYLSYFEKFVSNPAFLDSAKRYLPDHSSGEISSNFRTLIRWAYLKKDYRQLLSYLLEVPSITDSLRKVSYSNEDAWTAYRIGEAYEASQQLTTAINYYSIAVKLAPFALDFRAKLASAQDDNHQYADAKRNYEFIIKENPKIASVYVNYGFMILKTERNPGKASAMYDKALELNPDFPQALINKAGISIYNQQMKEAKAFLIKALAIDPNNEQALTLLKRLN